MWLCSLRSQDPKNLFTSKFYAIKHPRSLRNRAPVLKFIFPIVSVFQSIWLKVLRVFQPQAKMKNMDKQRELTTSATFTHWRFPISPNLLVRSTQVQLELCSLKGTVDDTEVWEVRCCWVTLFNYTFSGRK